MKGWGGVKLIPPASSPEEKLPSKSPALLGLIPKEGTILFAMK